MGARVGGFVAAVRLVVDDNSEVIDRAREHYARREELAGVVATLNQHLEEENGKYHHARIELETAFDALSRQLWEVAQQPEADQHDLAEALLLALEELDGYDEETVVAMRENVYGLMRLVADGAPVLALTPDGWAAWTVRDGLRFELEMFGEDCQWIMVMPFVDGDGADQRHTIRLEVADDDLIERLTEAGRFVGRDGIAAFLMQMAAQPDQLESPATLRSAVIALGLGEAMCDDISGV